MISPTKELIRLHAKQLRMPTFAQYEEVERQLSPSAGYDEFLLELLKRELSERQSSSQKRRIKQARFPYIKTMDEFDCGRCPNVDAMFLRQLAGCEFVKNKSNLVLVGNPGVGKTHLSNAIGARIKELHPDKRVLYVSAHLLQRQYTDSVRNNNFNSFMNFYQSIDVLIVDDIQEFSGLTKTQNTFFHIFNHLQQNGKQLILTSDRAPVMLVGMEDRLLTRFTLALLSRNFAF